MKKTGCVYNNTPSPRKSPFITRTSSLRTLRQYQQECSYCGMIGHNEADCLLLDIDIDMNKNMNIDDTKSSCEKIEMQSPLLTEFIPTKSSYESMNMRIPFKYELIPKKYWVKNCDPVKLFLNNNNIHNYRTQQEWKKRK